MTRDDVIWLAKEASLYMTSDERIAAVERFAELVAAAERKKYAALIDAVPTWVDRAEQHPDHNGIVTHDMINARMQEEIDALREMIRERGEA